MSKRWGDPVITFRIPERELEKLQLVVSATGYTLSDLIRDGVQKVLEEYQEIWTEKSTMQ